MSEDNRIETWVVGAEYDATVFDCLGSALRSLGYSLGEHWLFCSS